MKNKIMFGVYVLYLVRKLKSPLVSEALVFFVLGIILVYFVSIMSVLANMFSSPSAYRYFTFAFSNTTLVVQMILVLSLITVAKAVLTFSHLSSVGRARLS